MKRALFFLIPLTLAASGCVADQITVDDETAQDAGVSVTCATLNADIEALQALVKAISAGSTVTSVDGTSLTFSGGETAAVTLREAYDFAYVNPAVGVSSLKYWTLDGKTLSSGGADLRVEDAAIRLKGASNAWYAYYGGDWNEVGSIASGSSVPVFKAFSAADDAVTVTLSDGTVLTADRYRGTETLTVAPAAVSLAKEGGDATVTVTANAAWTATTSADWLRVTPASSADSEVAVTISAAANADAARTGKVSFTTGSLTSVVTVSQDGESGGTIDTGDTDTTADNIANTTFDRTVSVVYSTSGEATVSGATADFTVSVAGNDVTITNNGSETVIYDLSGTSSDGFFKLYSSRKQAIRLNGLNLANKNGAAINNQSKKRTFVVVEGTNTLADGSSYTGTPADEDEKAAFFSEGQLVFSGSGSLTVTATGKAGITSDDYVRFMSSPTVKVSSSAGHAVRGKDYIQVSAGTITASVSAAMKKGFSSDSLVRIEGGITDITVTGGSAKDDDGTYTGSAGIKADQCFEMTGGSVTITNSGQGGKGIKVGSTPDVTITDKNYNTYAIGTSYISGGTLTIRTTGANYTTGDISSKGIKVGWAIKKNQHTYSYYSGDLEIRGGVVNVSSTNAEAIECKRHLTISGGDVYAVSSREDAINTAGNFTVTDGYVCGISSGNDGLDSNGNCYIQGGVVYAVGASTPEVGIDANSEGGFKLTVSGGTLFVIGGLESGSSLNQTCYSASSWSKNTWYALTVGSKTYAFKTPSSGGSGLVVSGASQPTLVSGVTVSGGTSVFSGNGAVGCTYTGGKAVSLGSYSGGGGMGGGGGHGGGRW